MAVGRWGISSRIVPHLEGLRRGPRLRLQFRLVRGEEAAGLKKQVEYML